LKKVKSYKYCPLCCLAIFCSSIIFPFAFTSSHCWFHKRRRQFGPPLTPIYILVYSNGMKRVAETQISRDDEESVESQDSEEVCVRHVLQLPSNLCSRLVKPRARHSKSFRVCVVWKKVCINSLIKNFKLVDSLLIFKNKATAISRRTHGRPAETYICWIFIPKRKLSIIMSKLKS